MSVGLFRLQGLLEMTKTKPEELMSSKLTLEAFFISRGLGMFRVRGLGMFGVKGLGMFGVWGLGLRVSGGVAGFVGLLGLDKGYHKGCCKGFYNGEHILWVRVRDKGTGRWILVFWCFAGCRVRGLTSQLLTFVGLRSWRLWWIHVVTRFPFGFVLASAFFLIAFSVGCVFFEFFFF